MIVFWMKNQLVSNSNCNTNTVNLESLQKVEGMTNNVGLTFNVGDAMPRFTISIEQAY